MEADDSSRDVVHPEVRAHINSLVSALGGNSADDDGLYKLGDDALECLRDMKRWIRFYDEKTNRMDVARCLAEANLVGGDLLQILATWPENCTDNKFKARIALACYEIMVPLTWPIERNTESMTINHHRHLPVLQLAQLGYKRAIVNFDDAPILRTAVRVALPAMAMPIGERSPRDTGIIKLVLFFLRNVAAIAPPPGVKYEGDESQISRSATIDAFAYQDVFLTLLMLASTMGEDFRTEDTTVMEIIYHLVKRVDPRKLFLDEKQFNRAKADELSAAMEREAAMLRAHSHNAPKRHSRFGTMVWVKREDGKMASLSGQDALRDAATRELKMDSSKTFRPPRRARKHEMEPKDLGLPVSLNHRANEQLRSFVADFLDSGFNPLFQHVRKSIDREAPHVLHYHRSQFFYLVAWFLEAERMRRKMPKTLRLSAGAEDLTADISSFNLVAGVLNQEMFISLNRALDRAYNDKDWPELSTVMRCFTQILLTVQEMAESGNEENEEIADNMLNRLFYEEATHDAVANIVRTYKDQGFEYLDACTELTHTYLRILEAYSKQNVDLQVRSRRRTRRKKKAAKAVEDNGGSTGGMDEEEGDSADDERQAERTSKERKFDFTRFAHKFTPQGVVDTFVKLTRYYRDLDEVQLKRAHRFFHRVAFKQDMSVMLFRVDIIHLLYNMIKGPEPLDRRSNAAAFAEWEELVKQVIRRCVRKLEERPALLTEMLFSKINSTTHYLEYGYEKQTISTAVPRPAAELEFRHIEEHDRQIAIAVGALLDKSQSDHIDWVKQQLATAESERRAWEDAEKAMASVENSESQTDGVVEGETAAAKAADPISVRPDTNARRAAMFKNAHLRLLMRLVGIERLAPSFDETPESCWVIPAGVTADTLKEDLALINAAEFSPPVFDDDEAAADQLRRKPPPRKPRTATHDDLDGLLDEDDDEDGILFPAGGPTARKVVDAEKKKTAIRRRRRRAVDEGEEGLGEDDDEELAEKARKRREKEREKARKVKSEMYVNASDDETDDERDKEFFANEEAARKRLQGEMARLLDEDGVGSAVSSQRKRVSSSGDEGEDEEDGEGLPSRRKRARRTGPADSSDDEADQATLASSSQSSRTVAQDEADRSGDELRSDDTPLSSSPRFDEVLQKKPATTIGDEDDDDEPVLKAARARPRARGGFIVDSSEDED